MLKFSARKVLYYDIACRARRKKIAIFLTFAPPIRNMDRRPCRGNIFFKFNPSTSINELNTFVALKMKFGHSLLNILLSVDKKKYAVADYFMVLARLSQKLYKKCIKITHPLFYKCVILTKVVSVSVSFFITEENPRISNKYHASLSIRLLKI